MDSMQSSTSALSRQRSHGAIDDITTLTSFNPFSEEDEHDQSSYALVSSLFSKVRNTLAAPLLINSSTVSTNSNKDGSTGKDKDASPAQANPPTSKDRGERETPKAPIPSAAPTRPQDRPLPISINSSHPAPPLVFLTPIVSEAPSYQNNEYGPSSRGGLYADGMEGAYSHSGGYGTAIPGFPIADDAKSIRTNGSVPLRRVASVSKVIRRIRGEGLSRDYWMDDANAKECYDCKSVFTTWRRKHHCRICGQIFCARCASNIIKGSRFGHDGMIRVCNLCLEKLEKGGGEEDEDVDDRRSIVTSFTGSYPYPQSPFATSQLFHRLNTSEEPHTALFSIAEARHRRISEDAGSMSSRSRPLTPGTEWDTPVPFRRNVADEEDGHIKDVVIPVPVDTSTPLSTDQVQNLKHQPQAQAQVPLTENSIQFPSSTSTEAILPLVHSPQVGGISSVLFPSSSSSPNDLTHPHPLPLHIHSIPLPHYPLDTPRSIRPSRVNSFADPDAVPSFLRSRVQSRLDWPVPNSAPPTATSYYGVDGGAWRTRRDSTAYAQELNSASMYHVRVVLRQMLMGVGVGVGEVREWEETLVKLALRVARDLSAAGGMGAGSADGDATMDVRTHIKIKKIPGGAPRDSEYVPGAVITKHVAHRSMSRQLNNPRIMLVTFPFEFHRVEGQYMHLDPLLSQEKQYLTNLVGRVAALRPHVVMVEKSVSRLALEKLVEREIVVVRNVKSSAVRLVAGVTGSDLFSSMDKLATVEPRLGHCMRFKVQTFDHPLIPGRRKTYMRFELDTITSHCTILLRGGDWETLKRIKGVMKFLVFVVRHLRMETHLWRDFLVVLPTQDKDKDKDGVGEEGEGTVKVRPRTFSIPTLNFLAGNGPAGTGMSLFVPPPQWRESTQPKPMIEEAMDESSDDGDDLPHEDAIQLKLTRRIDASVQPYLTTILSVSSTLKFPPPYPIRRMKELDDLVAELKCAWEDYVVGNEEVARRKIASASSSSLASSASATLSLVQHDRDATIKVMGGGGESELQFAFPKTPMQGDALSLKLDGHLRGYFDRGASDSSGNTTSSSSSAVTPTTAGTASTNLEKGDLTADFENIRDSIASIVVPAIEMEGDDELPQVIAEKPVVFRQVSDIAKESSLSLAQFHHEEFRPVWEWYFRNNKDDFRIEKYQTLTVMEFVGMVVSSSGSGASSVILSPVASIQEKEEQEQQPPPQRQQQQSQQYLKSCISPHLTRYGFYGENDCTLGHLIDRVLTEGLISSQDGKAACPTCEEPKVSHARAYVHNESRLIVTAQPWNSSIRTKMNEPPLPEIVTTWSVCRFCGQATPFLPVSEETLRYSFAKFLELHFYPAEMHIMQGAGCEHNIYSDHSRYFAFEGMVICFQAEQIILHEVIFPPRRIRVRPETLLELKNVYYQRILDRSSIWFGALIQDLKWLMGDLGDSDPEASMKAAAFMREADKHRVQMAKDTHRIYDESPPTDTLALGRARQLLQEYMVEWQAKIDTLPRPRIVSEKEQRSSTFGSVRNIWQMKRSESSSTLDKLPAGMSEVEEEYKYPLRMGTPGPPQSSASETESISEKRREVRIVTTSDREKEKAPVHTRPRSPLQAVEDVAEDSTAASQSPTPALSELPKSEVDSDSTIGVRHTSSNAAALPSRLPRRQGLPRTSVAELVKRYQEGKTDNAEVISTPHVESSAPLRPRRTKGKKPPGRLPLLSDFEQSYAANLAPKYLTHAARRQATNPGQPASRIPGPVPPAFTESAMSSRQVSPEKRARATGPPPKGIPSERSGKGKATLSRVASREKQVSRPPAQFTLNRSTFRRTVSNTGNKVSDMTRRFERISRESERANRRGYAVIRGRRARPVASARPSVHVFDNIRDVMPNESDSSDESSDADDEGEDEDESGKQSLASLGHKDKPASEAIPPPVAEPEASQSAKACHELDSRGASPTEMIPILRRMPSSSTTLLSGSMPSMPPSPGLPSFSANSPSLTPPDGWGQTSQERRSLMKAISGLWNQQFQPSLPKNLSDSFDDPVHIHRDSPIALRTDEPTSIIAVALSCKDYRERQKVTRMTRKKTRLENETFMPDNKSIAESTSSWSVVDLEHIEDEGDAVQFLKQSSSAEHAWSFDFLFDDVIITCVVMFPEQFHALRRVYECEKSIIESLARCVKWNATGGKSGSGFLKTRDDRFIAKELSKAELSAMATFAPAYFEYMASTIAAGQPTLLAKIFGCFRISFTKPRDPKLGIKGKTYASSVFLVMENLFYDRRFTKIYDLKGSTRNRHVTATGRENEVLLDENLVKMAHTEPLYIREHSKRILRVALWNDSKFLADLNVMDYSLVVGVDSTKNELVMGIVDYIRTYTWDKKLENWVKDSSFLGGGASKDGPTIVTPKQYKARFRSAMERYFPLVPDRWMKQFDKPDEEGDNLLEL